MIGEIHGFGEVFGHLGSTILPTLGSSPATYRFVVLVSESCTAGTGVASEICGQAGSHRRAGPPGRKSQHADTSSAAAGGEAPAGIEAIGGFHLKLICHIRSSG
jgi:hypothetical protein